MTNDHAFAVPTPEPKWPRNVPDAVWAPTVSALLIVTIGGLAYLYRQPWLFASLGPTAFLITETPGLPASKFYNTVVGHVGAVVAGIAAVWIMGAMNASAVAQLGYPLPERIWASVIAVVLTLTLGATFKASHPPAGATTLLFTLGVIKPNMHGAESVLVGVVLIAVLGEFARAARLGRRPIMKDFLPLN